MNEELAKRVRAAAVAGWWTLLIVVAFVTVQWLAFLWIISTKPAWMAALWGPNVT